LTLEQQGWGDENVVAMIEDSRNSRWVTDIRETPIPEWWSALERTANRGRRTSMETSERKRP
jgi:hypothetical protein